MKIAAAAFYILMVTAIGAAQNDGRTSSVLFPLFADGRFPDGTYYRSTVMSSNPSVSLPSTCATTAWVNGFPASGSTTYNAGAWNIDPSTGAGELVIGYITMTCTEPINANLLYSYYSAAGRKLSEATVFPSPVASALQLLADQSEGARLGIAIVNDQPFAQTATLVVGDESAGVVANVSIPLGARQTITRFLDELTSVNIARAQVILTCPSGCGVVGLRFTGAVFTTIPPSVRIE